MDEYLCLTLLSPPGEGEPEFKGRLSSLWSALLRGQPAAFEKVYAEATAFERHGNQLGKRYLVETGGVEAVTAAVAAAGLALLPIDPDDLYSKYEAAPPEWFWIEH